MLALSILEAGDVGTLGVAGALGDGETWGEGPSSSTTSKVISKMSDILIGADVGICSKLIARLGNDTLSPVPFILH